MAEPIYAVFDKLKRLVVSSHYSSLKECNTKLLEMQETKFALGEILQTFPYGFRVKATGEDYAVVALNLREAPEKKTRTRKDKIEPVTMPPEDADETDVQSEVEEE